MLDQLIPGFWGNPEKQGAAAPLTLICLPLITTFWLNLTERAILRNRVLLQHLCWLCWLLSLYPWWWVMTTEDFGWIWLQYIDGTPVRSEKVNTHCAHLAYSNFLRQPWEKGSCCYALASHIWKLYLEAVTYLNISWIMFLFLKLWYSRFIWKYSCCMALKLAMTYIPMYFE